MLFSQFNVNFQCENSILTTVCANLVFCWFEIHGFGVLVNGECVIVSKGVGLKDKVEVGGIKVEAANS